jgi:lipid-A-disaccharide synthase-like uncharacterized protein
MIEQWREVLYPLGFLSSFVFACRFLVQWIYSEMQQKSLVTKTFWKLSLLGNFLLLFHSIIQMQFHVALIQVCNGVISWRNINLMQSADKKYRFTTTIFLMIGAACSLVMVFLFLDYWFQSGIEGWFRIPAWRWQKQENTHISFAWHLIGLGGLILFNSRFWIQWLMSEQKKTSSLSVSFWWMSLIGDIFCLVYFLRIGDFVNFIGPALGFIPYLRNLILIYRSAKTSESSL